MVRWRWSRFAGVLALVAVIGVAAAAFQIDPALRAEITTPTTGLWVPSAATGEILLVDDGELDDLARQLDSLGLAFDREGRIVVCVAGMGLVRVTMGGAVELHSLPKLNHRVQVTSGVLEDPCREILQAYFNMKRGRDSTASA